MLIMLFRFPHRRATLHRAMESAVAGHRPQVLRELLGSHGESAFAAALSLCTGRVMADALSMLPADGRWLVFRRLPKPARERCARAGGQALPMMKAARQGAAA
jgi:hypothetical protein